MRSSSPDRSPSPSNLNTFITEEQFRERESEERIIAIEDNDLKKFKMLFNEDVDINSKHKITANHSTTLLHHAAFFGSYSIVEYLISKKADLETRRDDGDTALIIASRDSVNKKFYGKSLEDYQKTISLLIEAKADINAKGDRDKTPLDYELGKEIISELFAKKPKSEVEAEVASRGDGGIAESSIRVKQETQGEARASSRNDVGESGNAIQAGGNVGVVSRGDGAFAVKKLKTEATTPDHS